MYSRNYSGGGAPPPPPTYSGVMYPASQEEEKLPGAEQEGYTTGAPEAQAQAQVHTPAQPLPPAEKRNRSIFGGEGVLGGLFGRSITMEDLILVGLILVLIDSGADDELLIILAFLLLSGG